jgi:predicted XRE-type DNA-binding protein
MAKRAAKKQPTVFDDLGFSPARAENLRLRSELMQRLRREIDGLTQTDAAARLGVSQPRISDLVRGKLSLFSLDALVGMLSNANMTVHLRPDIAADAPAPRLTFVDLLSTAQVQLAQSTTSTWVLSPAISALETAQRGESSTAANTCLALAA